MTSVLLVDDEVLIRRGLRAMIESEGDLRVVGEAGDGAEVLPLVRRLRPDVVLMDVRMPQIDGIRATELLLDGVDDPPRVLVVTTFENDEYVYDALRAGASGFVLKRVGPEHYGGERSSRARRWTLTDREEEILRLIATGATNGEIAQALFISVETVKTHVGNVLAKLGARDRTQAVIEAYETGFMDAR